MGFHPRFAFVDDLENDPTTSVQKFAGAEYWRREKWQSAKKLRPQATDSQPVSLPFRWELRELSHEDEKPPNREKSTRRKSKSKIRTLRVNFQHKSVYQPDAAVTSDIIGPLILSLMSVEDLYIAPCTDLDARMFGLTYSLPDFMRVRDICLRAGSGCPLGSLSVKAVGATIRGRTKDATQLKIELIQLVRQQLDMVTENLVFAVHKLSLCEMLNGNFALCRMHFDAINRMIMVLGGFKMLSFGLQSVIAWHIISLPWDLYLTEEPQTEFDISFRHVIQFCRAVQQLSLSKRTPYPLSILDNYQNIDLRTILLSDTEDPGDIFVGPPVHILTRLFIILYLHSICLERTASPKAAAREILKLHTDLERMYRSTKSVPLKSIAVNIHKSSNEFTLRDPDRTERVLRMISALKRLNMRTLRQLCVMLFEILDGIKYGDDELHSLGDDAPVVENWATLC